MRFQAALVTAMLLLAAGCGGGNNSDHKGEPRSAAKKAPSEYMDQDWRDADQDYVNALNKSIQSMQTCQNDAEYTIDAACLKVRTGSMSTDLGAFEAFLDDTSESLEEGECQASVAIAHEDVQRMVARLEQLEKLIKADINDTSVEDMRPANLRLLKGTTALIKAFSANTDKQTAMLTTCFNL